MHKASSVESKRSPEILPPSEKEHWSERLKRKWGITSSFSFWMIMLTFSLAGLSITRIRPLFWGLLGFTKEHPSLWVKVPTYLLLVFPTYQISLLIFGTLLGQFRFFWNKEKALFRAISKPFRS